ncbi:uncharacterized protein LOC142241735 [Haematobia irritans]|uniref:uncharacterized protein LOC142241735 n=1 Tax=Haematobia irritans TaxID=7368 RepID=UPI003F5094E4
MENPQSVKFNIFVFVFIGFCLSNVRSAYYQYFFANEDIFEACDDAPKDSKGIGDPFEYSQMTWAFDEGSAHLEGNLTCIWEGVEASDRIEGRAELYKFQRGAWQPTVFSVYIMDVCAMQFDNNFIGYQIWTQHINEQDRKCLNNYNQTYRHRPYDVNTTFEFNTNVEGRYKTIVTLKAFDKFSIQRPKVICYAIEGEFVKVK